MSTPDFEIMPLGERGAPPMHEVDNVNHRLRFRQPNGAWGDWIDGPPGPTGPTGPVAPPMNTLCAVIGDSISWQSLEITATQTLKKAWGYVTWAEILSEGRIRVPVEYNVAEPGKKVSEILAEQLPQVLALDPRPGWCIVLAGTNSINDISISAASIQSDLSAIWQALIDVGIRVVAVPPPPFGEDIAGPYPAAQTRMLELMQWVRDQKDRPGLFVAPDYIDDLIDPLSATAAPVTGEDYNDGFTHPANQGAFYIGRKVAEVFKANIAAATPTLRTNRDLFDFTHAPRGNLIVNGMLAGGGGTLTGSNWSPGSAAPDEWTVNDLTSISLAPLVSTLETRPDGRPWRRFDIPDTFYQNSNIPQIVLSRGLASVGYLNAGDVVEAVCEFEVDAGAIGLAGVALAFAVVVDGVTHVVGDNYSTGSVAIFSLPPVAHGGVLRTPRMTIPAGAISAASVYASIQLANASAPKPVKVTARIGAISLRKVD